MTIIATIKGTSITFISSDPACDGRSVSAHVSRSFVAHFPTNREPTLRLALRLQRKRSVGEAVVRPRRSAR